MNKQKRKNIGIFLSSLFFLVFIVMSFVITNEYYVKGAGTSDHAYMKFPDFDPSHPEGTEKNPFIILEIVPHRSMGQIGYVVGGQEPVNLAKIQAAGKWGEVLGVAQDSFVEDEDGPYRYKNAELFRKYILKEDENYHIRVVTITPDKLNENVEKFSKYYDLSDGGRNKKVLTGANRDGEIDLIGHADLISISPMAQAGKTLTDIWFAYGRDTAGADYDKKSFKDKGNDISWQTAMELFMKIGMVENKAPLIYDYRIMTTNDVSETIGNARAIHLTNETGIGYSSNIYKLCLMLKQYDPQVFFNMYLNPDHVTGGARIIQGNDNGRSTGSILLVNDSNNPKPEAQQLPAASRIYWGEHTFLPPNPFGPPLSNVGESMDYQRYLNDNGIIFSYVAGTGQYHDAVIRNVYHYNGGSSIVQYFNFYDREDLCVKDDNDGVGYDFNEEFFTWLEEEKYAGVRPQRATPLEAVEYILNVSRRRSKDIHVLELQPCNDFSLTPELVKNMIPGLNGTIRIEQQTTAEFIGSLEDLNSSYDLIYVGANTGTMNKDSHGKTVYNDPALDGLIYLHVGDRMIAYDVLNGAMKDSAGNIIKARDQITGNKDKIMKGLTTSLGSGLNIERDTIDFYRFSGNDITKLKYQELKEYVAAGYPVIYDGILGDGSYIDRNLVDDSSYIYRFLQECRNEGSANVIPSTRLDDNRGYIKSLLQKDKLAVTILEGPQNYNGDPSSRIAGRELSFRFRIDPPSDAAASTRYDWAIYVDDNADGKYSENEKIKYGLNVPHSVEIFVSQGLPKEDYADVIPWIIKVKEAGNNLVRTQIEGMAAFKQANSSARTKIYVLQITSDDSTINLEKLLKPRSGKTTLFYEYTKDLKDFELVIKTITVSQLLNMYNPAAPYHGTEFDPYNPQGTSKFITTIDGQRKYYDMLIFGFGDCYTDIHNRHHALDDISHYIQTGRSVMFTHDTTSFVNLEESKFNPLSYGLTFWGYGINQFFRNTLGLDRFGVMRKAFDTTPYDIALMPSQAYDIYGGATYYPERQGLTYSVLMAYSNPGGAGGNNPLANRIHYANRNYPVYNKGNEFKIGNHINDYHTNRVTRVNEGQITSYPYKIPETFTIAKSHAQYYQLNMEDPEITVWYCLSDNLSGDGSYSVSPNDVRNNYYIYSKKNIMYTVVGHEAIDGEFQPGTANSFYEDEVKLFINCIIASYQAGMQGPRIEITNEDARINSSGEYMMIANTDLFESTDTPAPTKRVLFKVNDPNLIASTLSVRIYRFNQLGEAVLIKPDVFKNGTLSRLPDSSDGKGVIVEADKEYFFDLPLGAYQEYMNGKASLYINVTNEGQNLHGGANASIIPLKLFDLD